MSDKKNTFDTKQGDFCEFLSFERFLGHSV